MTLVIDTTLMHEASTRADAVSTFTVVRTKICVDDSRLALPTFSVDSTQIFAPSVPLPGHIIYSTRAYMTQWSTGNKFWWER